MIAGPSATAGFLNGYAGSDHVYQTGNFVDVDKNGKLDGRAVATADFEGDTPPTFETAAHNMPPVPVTVLSAQDAYARVLTQAGTCQHRDGVEQRLIGHLQSLGTSGAIITDENVVGGQPAIMQQTRAATFDTDGDGMSDAWESAHGLKPSDPSDGNGDADGNGYTNVEEYLNSLADAACGSMTPPPSRRSSRSGRSSRSISPRCWRRWWRWWRSRTRKRAQLERRRFTCRGGLRLLDGAVGFARCARLGLVGRRGHRPGSRAQAPPRRPSGRGWPGARGSSRSLWNKPGRKNAVQSRPRSRRPGTSGAQPGVL